MNFLLIWHIMYFCFSFFFYALSIKNSISSDKVTSISFGVYWKISNAVVLNVSMYQMRGQEKTEQAMLIFHNQFLMCLARTWIK